VWAAGLALLLAGQTAARMAGHRRAFATPRVGYELHLVLIAAWLGLVALLVWRLPQRWRGVPVAAIALTLLMGGAHALATYSDLFHLTWYYFTHAPAPVWLPFRDPGFVRSLLASIGIGAGTAAAIIALLLAVHLLLYAVIADPLALAIKRLLTERLTIAGRRRIAVGWLAGAPLALFAIVTAATPVNEWRAEMLHRSARTAFAPAPAALMFRPPADGPAPPPVAAADPRPLVLIIVDALRRDTMGVYDAAVDTTPFLRHLRESGKLHAYSGYSTCTFSYCGIMSVLASRSWDQFGRRPPTVLDALARHSYRNHIVLSGSHEDFGNITRLYGRGVVQLWEQGRGAPADDRLALRALAATVFDDPVHSFLYLHLMSTHAGALVEPEFANGTWPDVPYATAYRGRVRQADDKLRQVFAMLAAK
jgi:hypothetical protein